ncbi:hypothetical protein NYE22_04515 [Bacillus sp. FSL K6-1560]|uniref:hypothetical protein n=1 Tax=Bacillus TaxID=1386 RepID=UPI0003037822|nr:hypothetical protein [Bacillus subtilis]KMN93466.1 hypothetical protein VL08_17670 [Bacillus subtilis]MDP8527885.1 hypothetical protein [Bacillus subtilis]MEC1056289.1 hypothetical protein [Bacillus subtilis]MED1761156.1 hypothetical protein [Bacillus subtilis]CAF1787134.1 hypothetical protein NRS6108_04369 [Bacillus subtilis]
MSKSKEINEFGEIKSVLVYLEEVKKGVHNKSLSEQIEFKEEIKKRHDKKQIQVFLGKLEDKIEIKKATSHLITAFFAIVSLVVGGTMSFLLGIIKEDGFDSAAASFVILYMCFVAGTAWFILTRVEFAGFGKICGYKRLLQECLDEMPDNKRHVRRRV